MGSRSDLSMLVRAAALVALVALESLWLENSEVARSWTEAAQAAATASTSWILAGIGVANEVKHFLIEMEGGSVRVSASCVGFDLCLFVTSAMLVYPAQLGWKIRGVAATLLAVPLLNWIRVFTLALLVQVDRGVFDFTHIYVWPGLLIVACAALLLLWVRAAPGGEEVVAL